VLRAARRVAWENQIAVRVGLIVGPAAHGIVMPARQAEAGLVVLGARAWSPGRGLGMTRPRIKRSSPVPVLAAG
jgi:Universal stress protein family